MNSVVRIDSSEIKSRLSSSLLYGNEAQLSKMYKLCELTVEPKNREMLAALDFVPTILLYGPPNTGKTTLVYRLLSKVKELNNNADLYYLNFSQAMSSEYGETSKNIANAFNLLTKNNKPGELKIFLIDEIDQFCMSRNSTHEHDASRRAMSALMLELDKIHPSTHPQLVVIAATNVEDKIDSAVTRRFSLKLKVNEKLSKTDFEVYVKRLIDVYRGVKDNKDEALISSEINNLYDVYVESNITIPDIKGVFRNILLDDAVGENSLYFRIDQGFRTAYSSVDNILRG